MAEKEKLPFWMGVVLGMLLGILLVLIIIVPQIESNQAESKQTESKQAESDQVESNQADSVQSKSSQSQQTQIQQNLQPPTQATEETDQTQHATHHQAKSPLLEQTQAPPIEQAPQQAAKQKQLATVSKQPIKKVTDAYVQSPLKRAASQVPNKGQGLALVLDDVGYDLNALKRLLRLSIPIAISILPDSPHARQAAELAKQAGQVVMLHLPMQPQDPSLQMGESFLRDTMPDKVLRDTFLRDLAKVPYVTGVNNHMGSKLTQLNIPMQSVMRVCQDKGLFFIDSRTSAFSVAAKEAEKAGLAWASRSIFLDHEMSLEAMKAAWQRARTCAKKHMNCIVIAHPRPKTVTFLENYLSKDDAANMVSVTTLLQPPAVVSQRSKAAL